MNIVKKILPWFVFIGLILFLIIGFASKDKLNQYLSNTMIKNAAPQIMDSGAAYIDSAFNYSHNQKSYKITFLEFGATGCVACTKMETVMAEVREKYPEQVNVVFMNILKPENQVLMKYFGIASIPTQILLDSNGHEFFRHSGYINSRELELKFFK